MTRFGLCPAIRRNSRNAFPNSLRLTESIKADSTILDGEIVGLDENNVPCFENLQNKKLYFIVYFAFDCLTLNGNDLRNEPLIFRKEVLKRILKKSPHIRYTDHIVQEGKELFITVERAGLEGIVGKKVDSRYVGGRTKEWLKIKTRAGTDEETCEKS